jgi:hypothetical protein
MFPVFLKQTTADVRNDPISGRKYFYSDKRAGLRSEQSRAEQSRAEQSRAEQTALSRIFPSFSSPPLVYSLIIFLIYQKIGLYATIKVTFAA